MKLIIFWAADKAGAGGGGWGGVLLEIFDGAVQPGSSNLDPISDKKNCYFPHLFLDLAPLKSNPFSDLASKKSFHQINLI